MTGPARTVQDAEPETVADRQSHEELMPGRRSGIQRLLDRSRRPPGWVGVLLPALLAALVGVLYRAALTKPLYFDEQWRAYRIAQHPSVWTDLHHGMAPLSFGWLAIERLSIDLFGVDHAALRAPDLLGLALLGVGCYLLGRRWLPPWVAVLTGALGVVMAPSLAYGLMLKPFAWEAAATAFALEFWLMAHDAGASARRQLACYGGIVGCVLISTPLVVVLPCLLLWDGVTFLRSPGDRYARIRLAAAVGVVAVVAAHFFGFLLQQEVTDDDVHGWRAYYLPLTGLGPAVSFAVRGLGRFPALVSTAGWLPADAVQPWVPAPLSRAPTWGWPTGATVGVGVALVIGCVRAVAVRQRRPLALTTGSALVLLLAASARHAWPFGAVRLNFFLFPLVLLLAVTGLADVVRLARSTRFRVPAVLVVTIVALLTLLVQVQRDVQLVAQTRWRMGGAAVADAAGQIRGAGPNDLVVLTSHGAAPPRVYMHGWYFYLQRYQGYASSGRSHPLREDQILSLHGQPVQPVRDLLAVHPAAETVFVFAAWQNTSPDRRLTGALQSAGFCHSGSQILYFTGRLDTFTRCAPR